LTTLATGLAAFADMVLQNKSRAFWSEVQRTKSCNAADGVSGSNDIASMFANRYDVLYSCVAYDSHQMASLKEYINNQLSMYCHSQECVINFCDI